MIKITDKALCCGCTACVNACPVQCIVMRRDREGFDYPVANPDLCIGCGKCEKVCPVLNPAEASEPHLALAARSRKYMEGSSSGGVFPALAERIIAEEGVVFGSVFNPDMTVGHADAEDMDSVGRMRGSKYVQSDLYSTFEEVKSCLSVGRKVMFTGTPCQIAGLKSYLGRGYDGLLTADCACHGVPSPGLWEKYLKALEQKHGFKISDVRFRDKRHGWRNYDFVIASGDQEVVTGHSVDIFMSLFLQDMSLRPSCYDCPARNGRSGSDITMADLWNVAEAAPEYDDDKGVSLLLVNTSKGRTAVEESDIESTSLDKVLAMKRNAGFAEHISRPERRTEFFAGVHSAHDLITYLDGFVKRDSFFTKVRRTLVNVKRRIMK